MMFTLNLKFSRKWLNRGFEEKLPANLINVTVGATYQLCFNGEWIKMGTSVVHALVKYTHFTVIKSSAGHQKQPLI